MAGAEKDLWSLRGPVDEEDVVCVAAGGASTDVDVSAMLK